MATRKETRKALAKRQDAIERIDSKVFNTATSIFSYKIIENPYLNRLMSNEIEKLLYLDGFCTIFYDEKMGILKVGRVVNNAHLGIYKQIVSWNAVMGNGEQYDGLNDKNAIIIYNNKLGKSTISMIDDEIERLVEIDTSLDMHITALRLPFVFTGKESEMLAFKTMFESIVGGEPVLYLDKSIAGDESKFNVFTTDTQYIGDKIVDLYEKIENRIYQLLGIQSNYIDKKAQVNTTEVNKNDDLILVGFEAMRSERADAVETFNFIFKDKGFNMTLNINQYLIKQRGEDNGENVEDKNK